MRSAIKLSSILMVGIVAVLAFDAYRAVRRETEFFRSDMEHDAQLLGHAMRGLVADVWNTRGEARALELIADANRYEGLLQIRWVWLDARAGDPFQPGVERARLERVVQGGDASFPVPDPAGGARLVTYVPVHLKDPRPGALELSESMAYLQRYNRATIIRALGMTTGLLLVSGVSVVILGAVVIGRPLRYLAEGVRRIGQGHLDTRLELRRRDELGELAAALNTMCRQLAEAREMVRTETQARLAAIEQLRQADRLATVGRLASGIAHEVGTPLNVISARAKQISSPGLPKTVAQENAAVIGRQAERIAASIRQFLAFARPCRAEKEPVDLGEITRGNLNLLAPLAKREQVSLRLAAPQEPLTINANDAQIQQVLTNVIVNAIQAMPDGGRVEVSVGSRRARPPGNWEAAEGSYACVSVTDEGIGIPEENLSRVFEPFFTTKGVGEGTGLGLSLAYGIVREHGGWIDVASKPGEGSCFSVYLPMVNLEPAEDQTGRGTRFPGKPRSAEPQAT